MTQTPVRDSAIAVRPAAALAAPRPAGHSVLFIAHHVGGHGGMERQSQRLVEGLLDAGCEVTVVARSCAVTARPGLRVVRVRVPRAPAAVAYPAFYLVASLLAARHPAAIVHTTGALVGNRAQVATVHYCHRAAAALTGSRASRSSALYRLNSAVAAVQSRIAERWSYRPSRTTLLCAVSGGVADELRAQYPDAAGAVRTVPNGVDSSAFRPDAAAGRAWREKHGVPPGARLALFVGGDWTRKGLRHALDALEHAPGWHLAVAGDGDADQLRARARSRGVEGRLHLLGRVADMPPVYAAAQAFVFPTGYEAFPLVALEAAASAVPLLVTRVNGVEDLLEDGRNGWFVEPDAQDIARRLRELDEDPERTRSMSEQARAAAQAFSWEAMTDGYLAVYAELAGGPR